ncbi:peptidase family M50-domain-containing protein, partial [Phakopsora pachyrhizi]
MEDSTGRICFSIVLIIFWSIITTIGYLGLLKSKRPEEVDEQELGEDVSIRPSRTTLNLGVGWLNIDSESFNNLSSNFLHRVGITRASKSDQIRRKFKDFDDEEEVEEEDHYESKGHKFFRTFSMDSILEMTYDLGTILSLIGIIFIISFILFSSFQSILSFFGHSPSQSDRQSSTEPSRSPLGSSSLRKRAHFSKAPHSRDLDLIDGYSENGSQVVETRSETTSPPEPSRLLQLMIPGITIPVDQLPIYLISLILSQTFHEFGHALVASLDLVRVRSVGFYLIFPIFPVLYVNLRQLELQTDQHSASVSASRTNQLRLIKRMRIGSAGIWHNVLLALVCWIMYSEGGGLNDLLLSKTLWDKSSYQGLLVSSVSRHSVLKELIKPGDLIYRINDQPMINLRKPDNDEAEMFFEKQDVKLSSNELWNKFLDPFEGNDRIGLKEDAGWCIDRKDFSKEQSDGCCYGVLSELSDDRSLCFVEKKGEDYRPFRACLNESDITKLMNNPRCRDRTACIKNINNSTKVDGNDYGRIVDKICVSVERSEQFFRIGVYDRYKKNQREVYFIGSKQKLITDFRISRFVPRIRIIPIGIEEHINDLLRCVISLSIGLAIMNLIPLPYLDGTMILESFFEYFMVEGDIQSSMMSLEEPQTDGNCNYEGYKNDGGLEEGDLIEMDITKTFGHSKPKRFIKKCNAS